MDELKSFLIKNDTPLFGVRRFDKTTGFLVLIAIVLIGLGFWSVNFQIDRVVRVSGHVVPTGHSRPIQHLEGGIVSSINVAEGLLVKKGDLLLSIDATKAVADLDGQRSSLDSLRARIFRLKAEVGGKTSLHFPASFVRKKIAQAETKFFRSRLMKLETDLAVHKKTLTQHQAALSEVKNKSKRLKEELVVAIERVDMLNNMVNRRSASRMELLDAQSRKQRLQTELEAAQDEVPKIMASQEKEKAIIRSMHADHQSEAQGELVKVMAEVDRLTKNIESSKDRVKRTDVRAPIDGTINKINVLSVGAVVQPGATLVELTPTTEEILIEAIVPPEARGEIQEGLPSIIKVTAYDTATLGGIKGQLKNISADTLPDQRGNYNYRARVIVEEMPLTYASYPILPGMTVTCDVVLGRRTILSHILSPFRKFTNNVFRDSR